MFEKLQRSILRYGTFHEVQREGKLEETLEDTKGSVLVHEEGDSVHRGEVNIPSEIPRKYSIIIMNSNIILTNRSGLIL